LGAILDIIFSLVIRGAIAIAILNMTIALQGKLSEKTAQANMFNLTSTVGRVMGDEMKMIGYNVSAPFFTVATKDSIEFTYYNTTLGSQRWVKYRKGSPSELSSTTNPKDCRLYRADGASSGTATPQLLASGVVTMEYKYFNATGDTTTVPANIKSFSIHLVMATGEQVNGIYPAGEWYYRFFPTNIN
jgi:hypothetical protein